MSQYNYDEGNYDEAFIYLNKMAYIYPNNSESYNLAGCIYLQNGEYKEAENCFIKSIKNDNSNADAQLNYAELLLINENYESALNALKKILENHPDHLATLAKFYTIYLEVDRYEDAEQIKSRILELEPSFEF